MYSYEPDIYPDINPDIHPPARTKRTFRLADARTWQGVYIYDISPNVRVAAPMSGLNIPMEKAHP